MERKISPLRLEERYYVITYYASAVAYSTVKSHRAVKILCQVDAHMRRRAVCNRPITPYPPVCGQTVKKSGSLLLEGRWRRR